MHARSQKKLFTLGAIIILIAIAIIFASVVFLLPREIHLLEGKEEKFSWNLPINADFNNENIGALSINNEKVEGNIHLSLDEPFTIKPDETGNAEVSLSLFGIIPIKTVSVQVIPQMELIPCGNTVGVTMSTEGVMVLGTGYINNTEEEAVEPAKGILKSGDLILMAEGIELKTKEDLADAIEKNAGKDINLTIMRDGEKMKVKVTPVKSFDDNSYKIGAWVRDSTQGIGTITYFNPQTNAFGALGHGVYDVDTKKLMTIKEGSITESHLTGIKKGEKGSPGELMGDVIKNNVLGEIIANTEFGLYGKIDKNKENYFGSESYPIGLQHEVQEGRAYILTNIDGKGVKKYEVEIESINKYSNNVDKGMVVKITDESLLNITNGIVQGMSGSPIIQDGKLIGAVTHVFVKDPAKGYGIFIESMLNKEMSVIK